MKDEWVQTIREDLPDLSEFLEGIKGIGPIYRGADANYCYCCYMSIRLIEIHRILRNTGSVYLHVDPTMSHYLKLIMDCIFGYKNFRNEIAWKRNAGHGKGNQYTPKKYGALNDTIIFYVKSNNYFFDPYIPLTKKEIDAKFDNVDAQQRRYYTHQIMCNPTMPSRSNLCYTYNGVTNPHPSVWMVSKERLIEMDANGEVLWRDNKLPLRKILLKNYKGNPLSTAWTDIPSTRGKEKLGYPTQKPIALLERIIKASSREGDVVLDPFCGCATACFAAEKLERQWIGIDVSKKAYDYIKKRLRTAPAALNNLWKIEAEVDLGVESPKRTDLGVDHREKKFVYVISNPTFPNVYKVGISKNWKARLNQYQTSDPLRGYQKEFVFETPYYREIEKHIQEKFDNLSEWVQGDLEEIIQAIKNYTP